MSFKSSLNMGKLTVILTLLLIFNAVCSLYSPDLIADFCKTKKLKMGSLFLCQNKKEKLKILKFLNNIDLRFIISDVIKDKVDKILDRKNHHLAVVLDGDCDILSLLQNQKFFFETYHWLIFAESLNETIFSNASLNINSDVTLAVPASEDQYNWTIYDIYNPAFRHGGQLIVKGQGTYSKNRGYTLGKHTNKYWLRKNMTGVHFKSAVVAPHLEGSLEEYLASEENRQINSMHRFQTVTVNHCRDLYNFTLHMQRTDSWGYKQENGKFDGLVGLLERRVVDFGSSPLICKLDRMPVVDYSYGNWILRSTFIYRRPKIILSSYKIFLRPFKENVWYYICVFIVLIILILRSVFKSETKTLRRVKGEVDPNWSYLVLLTMGAFCQQGFTCSPQFISSRTGIIFISIFSILIYNFYNASIVGYLLMDPPRIINNLYDLTESDMKAGIEDILIDRNYFVQTTDPVAIKLYNTKIKIKGNDVNDTGFYEPKIGMDMVRIGGFAYHVETSTAYPLIERTFSNEEICELEEVQMYKTQPMHTNLQKNSPFKEMMNFCMNKMVENGLIFRLRSYWDARKPSCLEAAKKKKISIGVKEISCGLFVLLYGILLSLIFLVYEIYKKKHTILQCNNNRL